MVHETVKIMGDPGIRVTATTVRVPVFIGHSESVNIETERKLTADEARAHPVGRAGHRGRRRPGDARLPDAGARGAAPTRCSSAASARTTRSSTA